MSELRWILLVAGVALIVALYVFGSRNRQGSTPADFERATRVDPPRPAPPAEPPARREPRMSLAEDDEAAADEPAGEPPSRMAEPPPMRAVEAPLAPRPASALGTRTDTGMRADPGFREPLTMRPAAEPPAARTEETGTRPAAPAQAAPGAARPPQKIVAIRVTAAHPERFDGALLREVLGAARFTHGRYEIFHRLDADGRPVMSLASLLEPGTFDPAKMDTAAYPGIALFAVMPGPLPAARAFDELLDTARWLAQRLGGQLQDDRGAPLSVQRVFKLREEVVAFERSLGSADGG